MKTYVLTVSKVFPKTHKRAGQDTGFVNEIELLFTELNSKRHTLRANYELWVKRAKEINEGRAILSIRYWSGKPYNSKQVEIRQLNKIGVQQAILTKELMNANCIIINDRFTEIMTVAKNDGLSVTDFKEWFKKYPSKPMAAIHFTDFRY